ncbi:MAG: hypothetical protein LC648_07200 [Novosphingobium sp.]|nr:hypothetical protein [Novosphingobium sp.]
MATAGALAASTSTAMAQAAERAGVPGEGQSELFGGSSLLTIALVLALGIAIFLLVDDEDDPDSP